MRSPSIDRIARSLIVVVLCISISVIIGYSLGIKVLTSIVPGLTAMNPVTAVCLAICGAWFLGCLQQRHKKIPAAFTVAAIIVLAVGTGKLLEYAGISSLHFDRWLFWGAISKVEQYNAMAPNTAILFVLSGYLMLNAGAQNPRARLVNDIVRLLGFLMAYLGIIGYIYNIKTAYQVGFFVPMALSTAICFIALYTASFLCLPHGSFSKVIASPQVGGRLSRRGIPLLLLIPPVFGYLRLFGERAGYYDAGYGTALHTAFIVLLLFIFLYIYARQLNKHEAAAQESLAEKQAGEKKYHALFTNMREGVLYLNMGLIQFCNPAFCAITGYTEEELRNHTVLELLIPGEQREFFISKIKERYSGLNDDYELQVKHKNGNLIWLAVAGRYLTDESGNINASFSTVTDITEKKKQAEDLEAFTASAAHDLSSPIARIQTITELLINNDEGSFSEEDKFLLDATMKTATEMRALLVGLLQFSKTGSEKINKTRVDMTQFVSGVIENNRHLNPKAAITLLPLPVAEADEQALKHVMNNLVSNALKYSSKKEYPVVEIGALTDNDKPVFYIKDNGAGFNMAKAGKLFSPFQRFHTQFEGNGLGLPIAKRIIEKHGGRIWAESEQGKGATFYFTLKV